MYVDVTVDSLIKKTKQTPLFQSALLPPQKQYGLHTILSGCGHEKITQHTYKHHGLKRGNKSFASLQLTIDGCGELYFDKKTYTLDKGKIMLCLIPHDHCYYLPKTSSSWEFIYLTFAGSDALRIIKKIQDTWGAVFTLHSIKSFVIIDEILQQGYKNLGDVFTFSSLAYSFLMSLLNDIFHAPPSTNNKKIIQAMKYCEKNYSQTIHLEDIAHTVRISQFHLARTFKNEVGITIQKYIESLRIQKALEKIINSHKSIKTIAFECGFLSPAYFTQVFKKYYGQTPSYFQNSKILH